MAKCKLAKAKAIGKGKLQIDKGKDNWQRQRQLAKANCKLAKAKANCKWAKANWKMKLAKAKAKARQLAKGKAKAPDFLSAFNFANSLVELFLRPFSDRI